MTRVRLVDVAREAGVSVGAASDALAGKNRIPEETRRRVREAAEQLGYVPNRVARALRSGRLPLLGLVIPSLRRPAEFATYCAYWGAVIGAGTLVATELGYGFVVLPGLSGGDVPDVPLAGMAVVDIAHRDEDLEQALALGIPVMSEGDDDRIAVRYDPGYRQHVELALDHLTGLGSERIALVVPEIDSVFGRSVLEAYRDWCAQHGREDLAATFDLETGSVRSAVAEALDAGCDAMYIVYGGDPDVEQVIAAHGKRIGTDVRVILQDEDTDGEFARRGLTTLTFSIEAFAAEALRALVDVIEGRAEAPVSVARVFEITERASTLGRGD